MSCCVSKLDLCRLVQESYKSPTFNFGDTDVTNDTFVYKVKIAGESFTEYPCTVIAPNIVVIDEYTLPVGNYIHEMLWTSANGTELIFQGGLKITSVGSCCGSNRNNTIKVIQNETVVRINVTESNIIIGGGGGADLMVEITHSDLLALVNNSGLIPGQKYRITDYVATVNASNYGDDSDYPARSIDKGFYVIVTADSVNKLNENAIAQRNPDVGGFVGYTRFEAWQLKYTIYNDTSNYDWAVNTGKGVIYEMIDEFNNKAPYDFKSIQFKRNDVWKFTFNTIYFDDGSLVKGNAIGNVITPFYDGAFVLPNTVLGDGANNIIIKNSRYITIGNSNYSHFIKDSWDVTIDNSPNCVFDVKTSIEEINLSDQLVNFTTPPANNLVEVFGSWNGVVMQQRVSASVTEAFDVV